MRFGYRLAAVMIGLAAMAAVPAYAATITQIDPADSLANADWRIWSVSDSGIQVGFRCDMLSPQMMNSPVVLQFILDGNDTRPAAGPLPIHLVNYDNPADSNVVIRNFTGQPWLDFHFYVLNMNEALPMYAGASLTGLAGVGSSPFSLLDADASRLNFSGGSVPNGGAASFRGLTISDNGTNGGVFYLKLVPTPEPATLGLLLAGILGLVRFRRRGV